MYRGNVETLNSYSNLRLHGAIVTDNSSLYLRRYCCRRISIGAKLRLVLQNFNKIASAYVAMAETNVLLGAVCFIGQFYL